MSKPKIGIRPIIDGRRGIRDSLEEQTSGMANAAAELISSSLCYPDGSPVECVIADTAIGGGEEAARCADKFRRENVCATLSVTPCWCYGSETMDLDPHTVKAVWGFNGTERPGAVYLAAVLAAHAQKGLPAFSIYGRDVQDVTDTRIPEDVKGKILQFARCAVAVGTMRGRAYVNIGSVSMGIIGSYCNDSFFQNYLGLRSEWTDMSEVHRRLAQGIYDKKEFEKALLWTKQNCPEGADYNPPEKRRSAELKERDWETVVKMALICRDILKGNPALAKQGFYEESLGKNAIAGGFQGQRAWSDWMPNADFAEAILNSSFDWNGKREPMVLATENDTLNAVSMLFGKLLTQRASVFADVRTYWSPEAVSRVTGQKPEGIAAEGFIHLINSGSAALDATAAAKENGRGVMKRWWEMSEEDIAACLKAVDWCPANLDYFRGGGYSSHFRTGAEMPVTLMRVNLIDGLGPVLQLAEGYTAVLPDAIHDILDRRTDPAWPTTWFVPRLTGSGAFKDVYTVMENWGANHGSLSYGHIGAELITLASMLRIPVSLHNVEESKLFRPHAWSAFGTKEAESADFRACAAYGPLYR